MLVPTVAVSHFDTVCACSLLANTTFIISDLSRGGTLPDVACIPFIIIINCKAKQKWFTPTALPSI
jgi:hypothetical protein